MESVITKREIPKDLAGIPGLRTGFHPPAAQNMRLVITGPPGTGKSTLLNSNPGLMMLDPERGGDTVDDPQAMRFTPPPDTPPEKLDKAYLEFVDRIIQRYRNGATDIQMLGIDSLGEFILLFQTALKLRSKVEDVGDVGGGHGKGYAVVKEDIFGMLDKVYQAGMGWSLIVHTIVQHVQVGDSEREVTGLDISNSYKGITLRKCEHMMFLEHGTITVAGTEKIVIVGGKELKRTGPKTTMRVRKLLTSPGGIWSGGTTSDVKVRVPFPDEMVLPKVGGWDTIASAYDRAVASLTGENK